MERTRDMHTSLTRSRSWHRHTALTALTATVLAGRISISITQLLPPALAVVVELHLALARQQALLWSMPCPRRPCLGLGLQSWVAMVA